MPEFVKRESLPERCMVKLCADSPMLGSRAVLDRLACPWPRSRGLLILASEQNVQVAGVSKLCPRQDTTTFQLANLSLSPLVHFRTVNWELPKCISCTCLKLKSCVLAALPECTLGRSFALRTAFSALQLDTLTANDKTWLGACISATIDANP